MTRLVVVFALLLSACSPAPTVEPTVVPVTLDGKVDILNPQPDTAIYDEVLTVSGTADLPRFTLQLIDSDDQLLNQVIVQPSDGVWCVELPHRYAGEPMPVRVVASPLDAVGEYASAAFTLSGWDYRPDDEPFIPHQTCSN